MDKEPPRQMTPAESEKHAADRRSDPRYKVTAIAQVIEADSEAAMEAQIGDLSRSGCYVHTKHPLSLGVIVKVRIKKDRDSFEAEARVVYVQFNKGMGLFFTAVDAQSLGILETWVANLVETAWLSSTRRRSQRVVIAVPVRISGIDSKGLQFEEECSTRAISAHGALIPVSLSFKRGQHLILLNVTTKALVECLVVHVGKFESGRTPIGVQFVLPNPRFWQIQFPPEDWGRSVPDPKFT